MLGEVYILWKLVMHDTENFLLIWVLTEANVEENLLDLTNISVRNDWVSGDRDSGVQGFDNYFLFDIALALL